MSVCLQTKWLLIQVLLIYQIIQAIWKVDKLDIDKLVPVLVNLSKLSDIVKNDLLKIQNIEDKIPEITNLATNASLNAKINNEKVEYLLVLT